MVKHQVLYKSVTAEFETSAEGGLTLVLKTPFDRAVNKGRRFFLTQMQLAELRAVAEGDFPQDVQTVAWALIRYEEGATRHEASALVDRSPDWINLVRREVIREGVRNGLLNRNWLSRPKLDPQKPSRSKAASQGRKGTDGASPDAIDQEAGATEQGSGELA